MTLLDEILNRSNLNDDYLQVYGNRGAAGVTIHELKAYLKENREALIQQIRDRKYKPRPVKRVEIPKDNGKKRQLDIPTVVD